MGQVINTNSLSLLTQNNLNKSQASLNTSIQRLSSGMRINSAKDDAAGQAIANRFTSNIKGLTQAQRNANDGISLAQTTEGALNEINTNLQRVRELTVQASTGSNSASDLKSIQGEITQRLQEIDRTSKQTDFNGIKVLGAGASDLNIQVGANDGQTIAIGLKTINSTSLSLDTFTVKKTTLDTGAAVTQTGGTSTAGLDISGALSQLKAAGVSANLDSITVNQVKTSAGAPVPGAYVVKVGDETYAATTANGASATAKDVVTIATVGTTFNSDANPVTAKTGTALLKVSYDSANAIKTFATVEGSNYAAAYVAPNATTSFADAAALTIDVRSTATTPTAQFQGVATANPLDKVDAALAKVDDLRGSLGAVQNRFDSIISNLGTTITNLSSSRSRIEDADYATEVSNMTRAQILQQAGTSVLAKANQSTQGVMSLLQ